MGDRRVWRDYLENILIAIILAVFVRNFVLTAYRVPTDSMAPVLQPGDFIFAFRLPFGMSLPWTEGKVVGNLPRRGDVVVFSFPDVPRVSFVRRVLGLPGDFVASKMGFIFINDQETSARLEVGTPWTPLVVPEGQVFVAQDDFARGSESDKAHKFGLVPSQRIEGRVQLIWLSLDWSKRWLDGALPSLRTERTLQWVPGGSSL